MFAILRALGMFVVDMFKSRSRLEAENLFVFRRGVPTPIGAAST